MSEKDIWVKYPPVDNTLGAGVTLPYPKVAQPSPAEIRGEALREFPGYIALEVTNVCNLRCTHCNYRYGVDHYTRDRGYMSRHTAEKTLSEAAERNITVLMNYDGESLMHKNYMDYLRLAQSLRVNSYFNTNGTLFDTRFADELVRFYRGSVFFSIDGDKEWYGKIRIGAEYERVIANLKYFIKVNKEHGWPITIGVSFCNLGQSAADRKRFLETWLPQVNYVSMGEVNDKFGTVVSDPMTSMSVARRPVCVVPWQTLGVCHNGDVIPCSIYITRANTANAIFGNIHEQSMGEIWRGEAFCEFRAKVAEHRLAESYCDKCQRWWCQFSFPDEQNNGTLIKRNAFWTTFHNTEKGVLNFNKAPSR